MENKHKMAKNVTLRVQTSGVNYLTETIKIRSRIGNFASELDLEFRV